MKENYTIESAEFNPNTYAYKTIEESGRMGHYSGKYEINYSSILTRLIQEAGRFCESFASDLFIDWSSVVEKIERKAGKTFDDVYLFGFRQNGVDHAEYVLNRYNDSQYYARHEYRSLWRLSVSADGEKIYMALGRVF